MRGADCDSDHYMINKCCFNIKLKLKIKTTFKKHNTRQERIEIENLNNKKIRENLVLEFSNAFEGLVVDDDIDGAWDSIKI